MRDGKDLASPGAGQYGEAWLKEPPETVERRCTPHLIQMIRREASKISRRTLIDGRAPTVHHFPLQ